MLTPDLFAILQCYQSITADGLCVERNTLYLQGLRGIDLLLPATAFLLIYYVLLMSLSSRTLHPAVE